jgi:hypothetical protein
MSGMSLGSPKKIHHKGTETQSCANEDIFILKILGVLGVMEVKHFFYVA